MYSLRRFPDIDRESWIAENQELVQEQVKKFEGLFEEPVKGAFEEAMADYVYLSNVMEEVMEWKRSFAGFLAHSLNVDEAQVNQREGRQDYHGGRMSMIKEVLEWF
jgi:hypothetical protein